MTRVVSFVGDSNSGKTTLIERLVPVLRAKGQRVAVLKHCHEGFDLDTPGSDSARFWEAGADAVALSGPGRTALLARADPELSPAEVIGRLGPGHDLVLVEGYKRGSLPKIGVFREAPASAAGCVAVVCAGSGPSDGQSFRPEDIAGIADLILRLPPYQAPLPEGMCLRVNGEPVPLSPFAQSVIQKALLGMVSALKGIPEDISRVSIDFPTR